MSLLDPGLQAALEKMMPFPTVPLCRTKPDPRQVVARAGALEPLMPWEAAQAAGSPRDLRGEVSSLLLVRAV